MYITEENFNTIDTKIKIEKDFIDGYKFVGTVFKEITATCMNSDKRSNLKNKFLTCKVCRKNLHKQINLNSIRNFILTIGNHHRYNLSMFVMYQKHF